MLLIALSFIGFVVFFTLTLRLSLVLMGRITGKQVDEKHRAAEIIIKTHKVPRSWIRKFEKRIFSTKNTPAMQRQAKSTLLKKLDQLMEYFKRSPLVKDKETRKILLEELQRVRNLWEEEEWEEIISS